MGYTTNFSGHIALSRKLTLAEAKTLLQWAEDPESIDRVHPGNYLQWVPSESLDAIVFDGNEKFYNYAEWMRFVLLFLSEANIEANGTIAWQGESTGDVGTLVVVNNDLTVNKGLGVPRSSHNPLDLDGLAKIALAQLTEPAP